MVSVLPSLLKMPLMLLPLALLASCDAAAIHADSARRTPIPTAQTEAWSQRAMKLQSAKVAKMLTAKMDTHHATLTDGRRAGLCDSAQIFCQYTTCDACLSADASYYWAGYCTSITQTDDSGFMGAFWGGGTNNCATDKTVKEFSVECKVKSTGADVDDCTASTLAAQTSGYFQSVAVVRMDMTISSSMSLFNFNTGAVDTAGALNAMSFVMYMFGLDGGSASYNDGPPSMYQSVAYMSIPQGGMTDTSTRMTGTNTYIVYDAGFRYSSASKPNGVGHGTDTDYTGVDFQHFVGAVDKDAGLSISGTGLSKTLTMYICSTSTTPQLCLRQKISASAFTQDGLQVGANAAKVDVFLNGLPYSGAQDSAGLRVIAVSTSFSGTVTADDTGNSDNEDSETVGACSFITENFVKSSSSAITSSTNWASFPSKTVTKSEQALTSATGSECGYSTGDWYGTASGSYANAKEFFAQNGFTQMKCLLYSFKAADASQTNMVWDPILGVDETAAASAASSSSTTGNGSSRISVCSITMLMIVAATQLLFAR